MPFQLALDEILFESVGTRRVVPLLRFYFSSEPWITVGYSQSAEANDQNICRRITGGGQVQHGADIIFSLIARKHEDESFGAVRKSYWKLHEAVKTGMESLGAAARIYRCDEKLEHGGDCFRFPIATDLAIDGKKVAGGAQKRSAGVMLHQESIQCLSAIASGRLMPAIVEGFEKIFQIKLCAQDLDPDLLRRAKDLSREKYERNFSAHQAPAHERTAELSSKN